MLVAEIQAPGGDQRVAFVTATLKDPDCNPNVQPNVLIVCDLQDFAAPTFLDVTTKSWDPCRSAGTGCLAWRINGMAHVRTSGVDPRDLV